MATPRTFDSTTRDLAYLLAAYRDANLAERTTSPPPFFAIELTIDEDVLQPQEFSVPDPPEWGDIPKMGG